MALNETIKSISLAGGLELKTDPKLVESPHTTTCDNAIYTTNGTVRKRNGLQQLPVTGSGPTSGGAIALNGKELTLTDTQGNVWTYSPTTQTWTNRSLGSNALTLYSTNATSVNKTYLTGNFPGTPGNIVSALSGNYLCVAYDSKQAPGFIDSTSDMYVGIFDLLKNAWVLVPQLAIIGSTNKPGRPCVIAVDPTSGNFYLFFVRSTGTVTTINLFNVFGPTGTLTGPTILDTASIAPSLITCVDAAVIPSNSLIGTDYLYAWLYAAGQNVRVSTLIAGSGTYTASFVSTKAITVCCNRTFAVISGDNITVAGAIVGGGGIGITFSIAPRNIGFTNNHNYYILAGFGVGNEIQYVSDSTPTGTFPTYSQTPGVIGGTITGVGTISLGPGLYYPWSNFFCPIYPTSKPKSTGVAFEFVVMASCLGNQSLTLQGTTALFRLSANSPQTEARVLYNTTNVISSNTAFVFPTTYSALDSSFSAVALQAQNSTELGQSSALVRLTFVRNGATNMLAPNQTTVTLAGAHPSIYDGYKLTGTGYDSFPELPPLTMTGAGTGNLSANTVYFYTAVYARIDAQGNRIISAPAPVKAVGPFSTAAQTIIDLTGPDTGWWPTYSGATLIIYRTTAADPLTFRQLSTVQFPTSYGDDNISDAALLQLSSAFPVCYVNNSPTPELSNDPPPAYSLSSSSQTRMFVVSSEEPTRLYFSKPFTAGRGIEFNGQQFLIIDPATGPITGISVIDANVVIFKAETLYVLTGDGPNAQGQGAYSNPTRIASSDGCINSNSIVPTTEGVYYQSTRGLMLVNRSFQPQYVGAPIEPLFLTKTITTGMYISSKSRLIFCMNDGTAIVYDTILKRWSTFSNYAAVSSLIYNGQAAFLRSDGSVWLEGTSFVDGTSTPIPLTIETGWIHSAPGQKSIIPTAAGPQGWGRLRRVFMLGDYKSPHINTLNFAYNYNNNYVDSVPFNTAVGLINGDTVYQWRTRAPRQIMESVRFKFVDSSTSGESYDITNLMLETSSKSGTVKLPGQKSV